MMISSYEVTRITRDTAMVGCAIVTRSEVEGLLKAMNQATEVMYRIQCRHKYSDNWVDCSSSELGGVWTLNEAVKKMAEADLNYSTHVFRVTPN